jgi:hypothetical protein
MAQRSAGPTIIENEETEEEIAAREEAKARTVVPLIGGSSA